MNPLLWLESKLKGLPLDPRAMAEGMGTAPSEGAARFGSNFLPGAGDFVGLAQDAEMFYREPESRTIPNALMAVLGMAPFVPSSSWLKKIVGASENQLKALDDIEDYGVRGRVSNFEDLELRPSSESLNTSAASRFYDYETSPLSYDIPIDQIIASGNYTDPKSVKKISALANEIKANGWIDPLFLAMGRDGTLDLMEGQHRLRALQQLGYKTAPARIVIGMD